MPFLFKTYNRRSYLLFYLLLLPAIMIVFSGKGADNTEKTRIRQLSGLVVTGDSLKPVPFATVMIKSTKRGTITDYYGFFSIAARELDTLVFSSVGFKQARYVIPDTLREARYSVVQMLTRDTIHLDKTVIYPWPSREQFKYAFIHTDVPDDDYDRAMRNLERAEMKERLENMPMGAAANYRHMLNQHANQMYYAGQQPPMRIFDPFAWAEFIKAWREGQFKRQD